MFFIFAHLYLASKYMIHVHCYTEVCMGQAVFAWEPCTGQAVFARVPLTGSFADKTYGVGLCSAGHNAFKGAGFKNTFIHPEQDSV